MLILNFIFLIFKNYYIRFRKFCRRYSVLSKIIEKRYVTKAEPWEIYFSIVYRSIFLFHIFCKLIYGISILTPLLLGVLFSMISITSGIKFRRSVKDVSNFYNKNKGPNKNFQRRNFANLFVTLVKIGHKPIVWGFGMVAAGVLGGSNFYEYTYGFTPLGEFSNWQEGVQTGYQTISHITFPSDYSVKLIGLAPWEFDIEIKIREENPNFSRDEIVCEREKIIKNVKDQVAMAKMDRVINSRKEYAEFFERAVNHELAHINKKS
jgi:hypothetical protein